MLTSHAYNVSLWEVLTYVTVTQVCKSWLRLYHNTSGLHCVWKRFYGDNIPSWSQSWCSLVNGAQPVLNVNKIKIIFLACIGIWSENWKRGFFILFLFSVNSSIHHSGAKFLLHFGGETGWNFISISSPSLSIKFLVLQGLSLHFWILQELVKAVWSNYFDWSYWLEWLTPS